MNKYITEVGRIIADECGGIFKKYILGQNKVTFVCSINGMDHKFDESFEDIKNHYGLIIPK